VSFLGTAGGTSAENKGLRYLRRAFMTRRPRKQNCPTSQVRPQFSPHRGLSADNGRRRPGGLCAEVRKAHDRRQEPRAGFAFPIGSAHSRLCAWKLRQKVACVVAVELGETASPETGPHVAKAEIVWGCPGSFAGCYEIPRASRSTWEFLVPVTPHKSSQLERESVVGPTGIPEYQG
jgi:hypothetical protein